MTEQDTFDELKYRVVRCKEGTFYYNSNDQLHRDNDQPALITADGIYAWYQNGETHRENDLPSVTLPSSGIMQWHKHGVLHRLTGPAIIDPKGENEYWVDGEYADNPETFEYLVNEYLSGE